jgi:hypothetical protein
LKKKEEPTLLSARNGARYCSTFIQKNTESLNLARGGTEIFSFSTVPLITKEMATKMLNKETEG